MKRVTLAVLLATGAVSGCENELTVQENGCVGCHRPGDEPGLEIPHASFALRCTDCHGGDDTKTDRASAHVPRPDGFTSLRKLAAAPLSESDADYLRFYAPTHPSVVNQSCGSASPQGAAGAGCHQGLIDTTKFNLHASLTGIITVDRFNQGIQPLRPPATAVLPTQNPAFQSSTAPRFTYGGLAGMAVSSVAGLDPSDPRPFADHFLAKACTECHLGTYGPQTDGSFRGVGCAACHVEYATDGRSQSQSPVLDRQSPGHPFRHEISAAPSDSRCETCHHRSLRAGLGYKGWREAGVSEGGRERSTEALYGKPSGAFVTDLPQDIHRERGMICADCHVGTDAHGDGHIRPNVSTETGIECEDCHGGFGETVQAGEDGVFRTKKGSALRRLSARTDGVTLVGHDGRERSVPQVSQVASGAAAHQPEHAEMECYACHTSWMQNYLMIRRRLDVRRDASDPVTGASNPGVVSEQVELVTEDDFFLGINPQGKIGTFMAEHSVLDVVADCDSVGTATCTEDVDSATPGRLVIRDFVGSSSEGRIGLSFMPAFQHTVRGAGATKQCEDCHPRTGDQNLAQVRAVYGYGSGEHVMTLGGRVVDLTQMIDAAGTSSTALGHLLATPIPPDRVARALMQRVE